MSDLIIDDDFCRRFIEKLPKQQVAWDDEKGLVAASDHWVSLMINECLDDPTCARLISFVKANQHLFYEYATKAGDKIEMSIIDKSNVVIELITFFCYRVLKQSHIESEGKRE
jgi:hypothetical protein